MPVQRFGELIGVTVGMCLLSTLIVQPALLRVFAPSDPAEPLPEAPPSKEAARGRPEDE